MASLGRYLYAAGGNDGNSSLKTVERYDPHVNKWTEVSSMDKRRAGVGLAALNGYLYAAGGFDDASPLDTVERYGMGVDVVGVAGKMSEGGSGWQDE